MRPVVFVVVMFAVVIGVPVGLYVFLTGEQRRTTRSIKAEAIARGWRFRKDRWQGNPAAFRIDGTNASGVPWVITSGNAGTTSDRGWSVQLTLKFPTLAGDPDFAIEPRESRKLNVQAGADTSGSLGVLVGFYRDAHEVASGWPAFDRAYRMLALPGRMRQPPVDSALAQRILGWPADAINPHSVVAWRRSSACQVEVRLPDSPNVPTILWLIALGDDLIARLPSGS